LVTQEDDIKALANEIAGYLQQREHVADTLDGIVQWWIMRQRLHEERRRVEQAMTYLCHEGLVDARILPDGNVLYVAASPKSDDQTPIQ
jgi:hypothetical protein